MNFDQLINSTKIDFNDQQLAAIQRINGATLLLAVPGSGKTTTIIARLGYMVRCLNINPKSILTLTYTTAATASMKDKYINIFGASDNLEFRTIHGICSKILLEFERRSGRRIFTLMDKESESNSVMRNLFMELTNDFPTESELNEIRTLVTYHRNMMSTEEDISKVSLDYINFSDYYTRYKKYKLNHKLMDYDDQLEYAYVALSKYPDLLSYFQKRYTYINVDEAQDLSKLQHKIIRLLSNGNIFMVGDEDQSIYSFRAAYPAELLKFTELYKNGSVLLMETNYRSTKQIIEYSNRFIKNNLQRYEKEMMPSKGNGCIPKLVTLHDFSNVYTYLYSLLKKSDTQTAVLYRNTDSVIPLVDILETNNLEYNIKSKDNLFFSSRSVLGICDILRLTMNPDNDALFLKTYYKFNAGITKEQAALAVKYKKQFPEKSFFDILTDCGIASAKSISRIKRIALQIDKCKDSNTSNAIRLIAFKLMQNSSFNKPTIDLQRLNALISLGFQYPDKNDFLARLNYLYDILKNGKNYGDDCKIILSTIHSSKGLEYDRVAIIDVKYGLLPINPSDDMSQKAAIKQLEEDRRIFYVAATRAKRELIVFNSDKENSMPCGQSNFINEFFNTENPIIKPEKISILTKKAKSPIKVKEFVPNRISEKNQILLRNKLKVGEIIEHKVLGKCRIASNDGNIVRVIILSDNSLKPLKIDYIVKNGLIE